MKYINMFDKMAYYNNFFFLNKNKNNKNDKNN